MDWKKKTSKTKTITSMAKLLQN